MRFLSILFLFLPAAALALEGVAIADAWAPPSLSQPNGVAFMTFKSDGDDALSGASSDCCKAVELHTHVSDGDVVRMRRIEKIELPDHTNVALNPGGHHLMLIGLKAPLKAGDEMPVTLHFDKHDDTNITIKVIERTALLDKRKASHGDGAHHGHH